MTENQPFSMINLMANSQKGGKIGSNFPIKVDGKTNTNDTALGFI